MFVVCVVLVVDVAYLTRACGVCVGIGFWVGGGFVGCAVWLQFALVVSGL